MYQKFFSLEIEKKERIINAALEEFTQNGFEKASTNEITKKANISKGSLFSYFNNKKELYLFLFDYISEVIDKIYVEVNWNETDIFNRIKDIGLIKFKVMKKYPQAFNFLRSAINEESLDVKAEITKISKQVIDNGSERMYKNIDFTKFRDDINVQKTIHIINWTIMSFAEEQSNRISSYEEITMDMLDEWDDYFDIMKRCFYKKEEQ